MQAYGDGIPLSIITNLVVGLRSVLRDVLLENNQYLAHLVRVYALYGRNRYIAVIFTVYIIAELGVLFWIYFTPSISCEFVRDSSCAYALTIVAAVTFELPGLASNNNLNSIPLLHRTLIFDSNPLTYIDWSCYIFYSVHRLSFKSHVSDS